MFNFDNNIEDKKDVKKVESSSEEEEEDNNSQVPIMNYLEIENREDYVGRDGELDWRCLTKK